MESAYHRLGQSRASHRSAVVAHNSGACLLPYTSSYQAGGRGSSPSAQPSAALDEPPPWTLFAFSRASSLGAIDPAALRSLFTFLLALRRIPFTSPLSRI